MFLIASNIANNISQNQTQFFQLAMKSWHDLSTL